MPFPYHDLRDFLDDLRVQGDLVKIEEPIDVSREKNELASLQSHVAGVDGPCLWLENLVGYNTPNIPLVLNVFGSRRRMAAALGAKTELEAKLKLSSILNDPGSWLDPTIVNRSAAPCKEIVIKGSDLDLRTQIPHVWFGDERQSYPNCDITASKDPITGELNASTYRYGLMGVDPDGKPYPEELQKSYMTAYAWWNPIYNDLGVHYSKAVKLGKPLDVAIAYVLDPTLFAIGGGPSILMGTHKWDKYALTGGVRGKPLELVKCENPTSTSRRARNTSWKVRSKCHRAKSPTVRTAISSATTIPPSSCRSSKLTPSRAAVSPSGTTSTKCGRRSTTAMSA
jgi:UbiD family decarboxylase